MSRGCCCRLEVALALKRLSSSGTRSEDGSAVRPGIRWARMGGSKMVMVLRIGRNNDEGFDAWREKEERGQGVDNSGRGMVAIKG